MTLRSGLYLFLPLFLIFSSCKKDNITGNNDYKTLGTAAKDLLTSDRYTSLKIQISYMAGHKPDQQSIDELQSFLETYINKPSGIQITTREIVKSGKAVLTLKEIVSLEKKHRGVFTELNEIGVHILITDTDYSAPGNFATSYWNTSFCIFGKTVDNNSGLAGQVSKSTMLSTLLQHEFGHLLGLVGQGSPMPFYHKDPANGAHCNNSSCLMFHDVETIAGDALNIIPKLDRNCIADLRANGGK